MVNFLLGKLLSSMFYYSSTSILIIITKVYDENFIPCNIANARYVTLYWNRLKFGFRGGIIPLYH